MKIFEVTENISHTSKRLRDIEKEKGVKPGTPEWFKLWFSLPYLKEAKENVAEGYKLQLERDTNMMVLHITDTKTGKRTEVRGKSGYENNGYDANDKLHQLLDKIGKSANVSELINGEIVTINPKHPHGTSAKAATDTAFNESLDTPYPYQWQKQDEDHYVAKADTPAGLMLIMFEWMQGDESWNIDFAVNGRMGKSGAGDEFSIFATVIAVIRDWVSKVDLSTVKLISFSADKSGDAGTSRTKLYTRFAKQMASQLGWRLEVNTRDTVDDFFKMHNPKTNSSMNEENGKEMLQIFRGMHHDTGSNRDMDKFIKSHEWKLGDFTPNMFPSEEEFFDYNDPFDRIIDIDYSHRVDLSQPIIVGPQFSDGKYSVIDGNHRAASAQKMGKTIRAYFPVSTVKEADDTPSAADTALATAATAATISGAGAAGRLAAQGLKHTIAGILNIHPEDVAFVKQQLSKKGRATLYNLAKDGGRIEPPIQRPLELTRDMRNNAIRNAISDIEAKSASRAAGAGRVAGGRISSLNDNPIQQGQNALGQKWLEAKD